MFLEHREFVFGESPAVYIYNAYYERRMFIFGKGLEVTFNKNEDNDLL